MMAAAFCEGWESDEVLDAIADIFRDAQYLKKCERCPRMIRSNKPHKRYCAFCKDEVRREIAKNIPSYTSKHKRRYKPRAKRPVVDG